MDGWAGRCWTELLDCAASTRLHVATDSEARMPADAHPEMPPAPVLLMHATRTHPRAPPHSAQGRQRMAISARISAKRSPHGADAASSAINLPSGITNQALFGDRSCASRASRVKSRNHRRAPNPTLASGPRFGVHSHANTSMNLSPEAFLCSCLTASSCISGNLQLTPPSSSKSL